MEYENWGCEFEGGWRSETTPPTRSLSEALWLPLELVESTVDPLYARECKTLRKERIEAMKISIIENGLTDPGLLLIGKNASKLQDGNHRLIACKELQRTLFPVKVEYSDSQIKTMSLTNGKLIESIISLLGQTKYK